MKFIFDAENDELCNFALIPYNLELGCLPLVISLVKFLPGVLGLRCVCVCVINRESLLEQCAQQGHGPLGVPGIGIFSMSLAYS